MATRFPDGLRVIRRSPATMRARDSDRSDACGVLDASLADGQLTQAEHDARVASAMHAVTMQDLHGLLDDLQIQPGDAPLRLPAQPTGGRGWLLLAAVVVATVLVVTVSVRSCSGGSSSGSNAANYLSLSGLQTLVRAAQDHFGTATVDQLVVYPTYAVFQRADPAAPRRSLSYYFNGDWKDPTNAGTRDPRTVPIDLARANLPTWAGLIEGAGESLNLSQIDTIYFIVDSSGKFGALSVHASNELGESGYLSADLDGKFAAVYPFDPAK
ncbi:DUF1707 domain-containing protein [Skermania sp. ID1734]|uniref:DUF1707 SHOCT-like domain-containing protein n=1 Tax=Skermania sp. ID1734 TaxID=2597516 RepID=UPI00117E5EF9|nr:DUF1707 domain-containing protein [Skermania sp. ID1734]TSD99312.1 DUF1707 domain-containing protein [Skermania sp. ID1734]